MKEEGAAQSCCSAPARGATGSEDAEVTQAQVDAWSARARALEQEVLELRKTQSQLTSYAEDLNLTYRQLRQRLEQMAVLNETSTQIGARLEVDHVVASSLDALARLVPYEVGRIFCVEPTTKRLVGRASRSCSQGPEDTSDSRETRDLVASAIDRRATQEKLIRCRTGDQCRALALPLVAGGNLVGAVFLLRRDSMEISDYELQMVELVAVETAIALQNAQLYEETQRLAVTDATTGIYNYRYFWTSLDMETAKARRLGYNIGLLMTDLDDFKGINDKYGHQLGNEVLRKVAAAMKDCLRHTDIVSRYGGDEFVAILPGCLPESLQQVGEKVRDAVARIAPFDAEPTESLVTISVGGAWQSADQADSNLLVKEADGAMYAAKSQGRNRVHIAGTATFTPPDGSRAPGTPSKADSGPGHSAA